jgi:pyruvate dehydrogenase (quinone)
MKTAAGVRGIRIEKADEVDDAIETAVAHDSPALVDAVVARTELAWGADHYRRDAQRPYAFHGQSCC